MKESYGQVTGVQRRPRGFREIRQGYAESSHCATLYASAPRKGLSQESRGESKQARTKIKTRTIHSSVNAHSRPKKKTLEMWPTSSVLSGPSEAENRKHIHTSKSCGNWDITTLQTVRNWPNSNKRRNRNRGSLAAFRPVVPNRRIVRLESADKLDFLRSHFSLRGGFRLPQNLAPDCKISPLLRA